jgi:predicted transcriptional regulator
MRDEGGGASRSTDPAAGTSSATDVSLREYLIALIHAAEQRSDARFESMKDQVDAAFRASQEAINKAELAADKRFESVNEFRAVLADQQRDLVTRQVLSSMSEKLEAAINRNRDDLSNLEKRLTLREGQTLGSRITGGVLVTVITVGVAILGLVIVLANYLTTNR